MKSKTLSWVCLCSGFLLVCCKLFAGALDNWNWRNPLPNGNPEPGLQQMLGIVFADGKFVAAGNSGFVSISYDSTNWTQGATATANTLNDIIYANGQFIAVGNGGTIETSPDGTNWILRNSGTGNSLGSIAFSNGKYVAMGGNAVLSSSDAINWIPAVSGLSGGSVAGGTNGFVAVTGTDLAYFSPDGLIWTNQMLTAPVGGYMFSTNIYADIVAFANGVYLIAAHRYPSGESADCIIYSSTDGQNWLTNSIENINIGPGEFSYNYFLAGGGNLIFGGTAYDQCFLQFSTNGVDWSQVNEVPMTLGYAQGTAGAYGDGSYVIVTPAALNLAPQPQILTSPDGLIWTNRNLPPAPPSGPTNNFTSMSFSNGIYAVAAADSVARSTDGLTYTNITSSPVLVSIIAGTTGFVGVGPGGNIYASSDGLSWTQRNSATLDDLNGIASGNNQLVAVGDNGTIQSSPIGTIWTSRTSGTSLALDGVTYANGLFVAVGQLGTVLTSPDGINWSGQYSGQLSNLVSVAYGSAGFAAVGPGGTMLTSPDGTNWTQQSSGTANALESIAFGNGYYLAVGADETALTSPDGVNWTPRNTGVTGGQNLLGCAFLNSRFDVVGSGGTILESDVVPPLFDLQIQRGSGENSFTVFAPSGSSFHIQSCTNLAAPVWIDAAVFNNAAAITMWTNTSAGWDRKFYRAISP
jgi:hypothetical protein